jgi:hypothetical protein
MSASAGIAAPSVAEGTERPSVLLTFGIVAAVLTIVEVAGAFIAPDPASPQHVLSAFKADQGGYTFSYLFSIVYAVGSIPFIALVGAVLRRKGGLVSAAVVLIVGGLLLSSVELLLGFGALWSISSTSAPVPGLASYEATYWFQLTLPLEGLSSVATGAGLLILGWAAWDSGVVANWLGIIAWIAGASELLNVIGYGPQGSTAFFLFGLLAAIMSVVLDIGVPLSYRRMVRAHQG